MLPAVRISAGCRVSADSKQGSSVAVGPVQCTGCLMVLSNLLRGCAARADDSVFDYLEVQ